MGFSMARSDTHISLTLTCNDKNRSFLAYFVERQQKVFLGAFHYAKDSGNFGRNLKWKGPFRFLLTGIFGITSGGGPHISVGIFRPKFAVPFLINGFFALIREFGRRI